MGSVSRIDVLHISRQNDEVALQRCSDVFTYIMCLPSILKFISRIMSLLNETGIVHYHCVYPVFAVWFTGMPFNSATLIGWT